MYAMLTKHFLEDAAPERLESGRCVRLDVTPSAGPKDLEPSQEVSLLAAPRSKIDGAAAGGSVTAVLTAGGATVAPSATKVPADATFTYTAPERDRQVRDPLLEARSKRGVAKALWISPRRRAHRDHHRAGEVLVQRLHGDRHHRPHDVAPPDGTFAGTAQVGMTGSMKMMQTGASVRSGRRPST